MDDSARAFLDGASPPQAETSAKLPAHRPSTYEEKTALWFCDQIAEGTKTLRKICEDPLCPARSTIFRWLEQYPDFRRWYRSALAWRSEHRADELVEIADDTSEDFIPAGDDSPALIFNKEAVARSKLRIETRQWLMAREQPKKYGDAFGDDEPLAPAPDQPAAGDPPLINQDPMQAQLDAWSNAAKAAKVINPR